MTTLMAIVGVLLASLLSAGPASADTVHPPFHWTALPAGGKVSCYGYTGTFLTGTYVAVVDWSTSSDECFGVATDGTIWHAWPKSGGWKRLGTVRFDKLIPVLFREDTSSKQRMVVSYVSNGDKFFCQLYFRVSGWTGIWYECKV